MIPLLFRGGFVGKAILKPRFPAARVTISPNDLAGMTRYPPVPYRGPLMAVCNIPTHTAAKQFDGIKVIAALDSAAVAGPWTCRSPLAILTIR
jgi:hypothetical protein